MNGCIQVRLVGFENLDDFQERYFEARDTARTSSCCSKKRTIQQRRSSREQTGCGARAACAAGPGAGHLGKRYKRRRSVKGVRGLYCNATDGV